APGWAGHRVAARVLALSRGGAERVRRRRGRWIRNRQLRAPGLGVSVRPPSPGGGARRESRSGGRRRQRQSWLGTGHLRLERLPTGRAGLSHEPRLCPAACPGAGRLAGVDRPGDPALVHAAVADVGRARELADVGGHYPAIPRLAAPRGANCWARDSGSLAGPPLTQDTLARVTDACS